jgi:hypothetical protein
MSDCDYNDDFLFIVSQMKEQIAKLKLEQLMYDEEKQRLRADAAEKYRLQLENFVDMICHEIRNPYAPVFYSLCMLTDICSLNGIFGNADLIFHHIEYIENMLVKLKEISASMNGTISKDFCSILI